MLPLERQTNTQHKNGGTGLIIRESQTRKKRTEPLFVPWWPQRNIDSLSFYLPLTKACKWKEDFIVQPVDLGHLPELQECAVNWKTCVSNICFFFYYCLTNTWQALLSPHYLSSCLLRVTRIELTIFSTYTVKAAEETFNRTIGLIPKRLLLERFYLKN